MSDATEPAELPLARTMIPQRERRARSGQECSRLLRRRQGSRVEELIDAKKHDKEFQPAAEAPAATDVADLMEALQASVESAKKNPARKTPAKKSGGTKAPARTAGKTRASRPGRKRAA